MDDLARKIYPKMLIQARTTGPINRSDLPAIPAGTECKVYRIVPREGYSL